MVKSTEHQQLCNSLIQSGIELNYKIAREHERLLSNHTEADYFLVSISYAFTWTGHAVNSPGFFNHAIEYLVSDDATCLNSSLQFAERFGREKLQNGLRSWRAITNSFGKLPDVRAFEAPDLFKFQKRLLEIAIRLHRDGVIFGIGPWLFCAPFKITAVHRRELWADKNLDEIAMPLGLEVIRTIKQFIRKRLPWVEGINENMIQEQEGGLDEGMGSVYLVQEISKKIASSSNLDHARVIHVNSGLHAVGASKNH